MHKPQKTAVLFQFTPLREGRRYTRATSWIQSNFNSRPSARGDANVQPLLLGNKFQFTPLREGRQRSSRQIRRACYFNSRPSARGDSTKSRASSGSTNFNSRPSARGDFCSSGRTWVSAISIHAPPRGATEPRRLADRVANAFQFTPLREGRHEELQALRHYPRISIHAPPRGATRQRLPARRRPPHFNSRPSARGDKSCPNRTATSSLFQFTPLREGRHPLHECNTEGIFISIHAPPRGATCEAAPQHRYLFLFQFTPLREGRRHEGIHEREPSHFNSRPSARGDNMDSGWDFTALISIHAPPRGATEEFERRDPAAFISIHAPPRGATVLMSAMEQSLTFQFTPLREGRPPSDRWG